MAETDALWHRDGVELARLMRTRQVSCVEVMQAHIARMEAVNPQYNAVVLSLAEEALAKARAADRTITQGEAVSPLHGVPITTKVNTDQAGLPNDNGVVAFKDVIAPEDSPQIRNLKKAGAVVLGRSNTPAFSMRWFTENALHGATLNPWNTAHTPGGSSGGAAGEIGGHGLR